MVEPSADNTDKQIIVKAALYTLLGGKKGVGIVLFTRKNDNFLVGARQGIRIEIADDKVGRNR